MPAKIKITKVSKVRKNYQVETNIGKYTFDEETLIKYQVFKDKEFTKAKFAEILNEVKINKIYNKTLNYLSYRMRSHYEVKEYLAKNDLNFSEADRVINRLKTHGYIDDEKFAKYFYDYYMRKNKGPKYIEQKLYEKRINKTIINDVVGGYSQKDQEEKIKQIVEKEAKSLITYPVKKQRQKLISKLIRAGFVGEIVYTIVNTAKLVDNSDERLEKDFQKQLKRLEHKNLETYEIKQKIIASLIAKGYEYQKIKELLE